MTHHPGIALPTSTCAIYTRQSADQKSDFTSCQAQFEACYCHLKSQVGSGWRWIDERFDDEGYSGITLDRPALQRLLHRIYVGKVHRVLIHRLDRLSRNIIDCTKLLQGFRQRGVDLVIVSTPELGSTATDVFTLNILTAFAEFEREMIRTRIAEARAALKQHGRRVGGAVPYGYQTDSHTKQLIVEPREASHIQAMFKMAADGKTPSEIAQAINQRGWRTKERIALRTEKVSGGNLWTARQVLATLSNPVYLGQFAEGKGRRPGIHEAIVSESLFEQVHNSIESRRTSSPGRRDKVHIWLLKGILRCAGCGRLMSTQTTSYKNRIYRYYRCRSNAGGNPPCKETQIGAGNLEREVFAVLSDSTRCTPKENATAEKMALLQSVSSVWSVLTYTAQCRLLPKFVKEIVWNAQKITICVTLDDEAIVKYVNDPSILSFRVS